MAETNLYLNDPNIGLMEKWRRHAAHKQRTGVIQKGATINYWGPIFYFYTIVVGTVWQMVEVLPTLYVGEWEVWLLPVRLLLLWLVVEVFVNWCGIRWVDSAYRPALHGTKPPDFPTPGVGGKLFGASTTSGRNANDAADVGLEMTGSSEGGATGEANVDVPYSNFGKRRNANGENSDSAAASNGDAGSPNDESKAAVDMDYAPPEPGRSKPYDGYSFRMMVAVALPTSDGEIERKPFPYWSWVPCLLCQRLRPPRCHHCTLCGHCVLKRDHHCYFTGRCIGLNNTRFFLIFLLWAFLLTSFGTYHILYFARTHMLPSYALSMYDLIFPVPLVRGILGYVSLTATPVVLVIWCIFFCNFFSLSMMCSALHLFFKGKTSFERDNSIKVTDTRSLGGKIRSVFGQHWWLNIVVPTYPWFKPVEDAVLWPDIKPW
ncbi:uncharacterized protein LOC143301229 [Babylonia areolata]|uniref:uncharacterized protein LOC143301229 n=1 Tax=Babylonia areolata TaxID=304850 RepID=UPI003FD0B2EB